MKAGEVVVAAILAGTAGVAAITLIDEASVAQQTSPGKLQLGVEGRIPAARRCDRVAEYRAWAEKYKDQGLVVIGVHSPEFEFEKRLDNVRWALKDMGIGYPVALDSNHSVWRAFRNEYWPALYFIDAQGRIRHHQFGEGDYDTSERVIQQLLAEAGASAVLSELASVNPKAAELAADWQDLKSPENYLGYERTNNFVSRDGTTADKRHLYLASSSLRLNQWALSGDWIVGRQSIISSQAHARIFYRFRARDLNLVMGPTRGAPIHFRVLADGMPVGTAAVIDLHFVPIDQMVIVALGPAARRAIHLAGKDRRRHGTWMRR